MSWISDILNSWKVAASPFARKIVVVVVLFIILGSSLIISNRERLFFEQDPSLSFYNVKDGEYYDQIPTHILYAIIIPISFGIVIITLFINRITWTDKEFSRNKMGVHHCIDLGLALLATACATQTIKNVVGRPRPSFYYLCNYKGYADAVNSGNFTLYSQRTQFMALGNYNECLNQNGKPDAISSFPSGHTSIAFSGMFYTVLILCKMFHITDFCTIEAALCFSPLLLATYIAITRVQDFKHHEDDIMGGFIIGMICTLIMGFDLIRYIAKMNCPHLKVDTVNIDADRGIHSEEPLTVWKVNA